MITASHNNVTDNGIKVADPSGGMLTQQWEPFADDVANAADPLALIELLDDFVKKENIKLEGACATEVFLGRDTRPSGMSLVEAGADADYVQKEKIVPRGFGPADAGTRASLAVVQTAYANRASTDYLKQLGLEVVLTPTGVKYLHEKAAEFDIGIYFETNGHGTIFFSDNFLSWLETKNNELSSSSEGSDQHKAALRLSAVSKLINQAVGDALSGLLLVEAILQHMGWSIHKWNGLYQDLPSRQLKVKVVDRTAAITAKAETVVVSPVGIQEAIDAETAKYPRGRCFIRPSGTEDVVRVYAEASTQEAADSLAHSAVRLVNHYLGFQQ
ncbi:Phosphoacetylglucosamine mutase [Striga hermonthica]|uniref:Phosphoacetylglucosamine mutase n=1 Tax=Striga hermonthica TaxID=68872 RepID=A0A9N7MYF9_STRHE|nr:Phosphoacetylglucosamine mutase [Striga hermonthica]